jgi:hypothetical protein
MLEGANRRVRFVMYDANEWLRVSRVIPPKLRGLFRDICDLQLINQGPIPADPVWIARQAGYNPSVVRALLPRLLALGKFAANSSESGDLLVSNSSLSLDLLVSNSLLLSANYMKNNKTADKRAREEKKEEESLPYRQRDSSSNARDVASASPQGGSAPPRAEMERKEQENVVQLHPRYPGCPERWESCNQRWLARGTICEPECRAQIPEYRPLDDDEVAERWNQSSTP